MLVKALAKALAKAPAQLAIPKWVTLEIRDFFLVEKYTLAFRNPPSPCAVRATEDFGPGLFFYGTLGKDLPGGGIIESSIKMWGRVDFK